MTTEGSPPPHRRLWSGLITDAETADIGILGVPFDGATSYRRGAALAPAKLRAITPHIAPYTEEGEPLQGLTVRDYGDVEVDLDWVRFSARVEEEAAAALRHRFALFLGGDHSVTIPLAAASQRAVPVPWGLIHIDAHLDLEDTFEGRRWSHACTARRVLELLHFAPEHAAFVGIRSFLDGEKAFLAAHPGVLVRTARAVAGRGTDEVVAGVTAHLASVDAVYLTLDIDVLDPAFAPGTGTPEAGGVSTRQLLDLLRGLHAALPLRTMDVVEVAPPLDPSDVTAFAAAKVIYETFGWLHGTDGSA